MDTLNILYVDDDPGLHLLTREAMAAHGCDCTLVSLYDGEEALNRMHIEQFDIVLIDQQLPGITGLEIIAAMQELPNAPLAIMVTGVGNEALAVEAMRLGARDYVVKDAGLGYLTLLPVVMQNTVREAQREQEQIAADRALALERERANLLALFVRDLSHEFRTPITMMKTTLYLLKRTAVESRQEEYIARLEGQIDALHRLLEGVIRLTLLEDMQTVPEEQLEQVDLRMVLSDALESLYRERKKNQVRHDYHRGHDAVWVKGDRQMLIDAFTELVRNAEQAVGAANREGAIAVRLIDSADRCTITLQDNGIGMTEAQAARVFERFYRADDAHSTPGLGLGLPIAARIIALHGGAIDLTSIPGEGTTVTVRLPRLRA